MSNPNLVRKISDSPSGSSGEISPASVISTSNLSKNYIINGDMNFAQRGTSFAAITSGAYCLDRYRYSKVGAMVHTVSRDSDVPTLQQAGVLLSNSLRFNLTTPDTSIAVGDYARIQQKIEGYIFAPIAQKNFTLSFWVKATLPGTYCVAFRNNGADRSYVAEYSINVSNTWEHKAITVSASPSSGGWNYTNLVGLEVDWIIAAGSNLHTTPNMWASGNFMATSNQINGTNTGATDFRIAGAMLNEGNVAAPFKPFGEDFAGELIACQRYYEKSYNINTTPGTVTTVGQEGTGVTASSTIFTANFKTMKRANPTAIPYAPATGNAGVVTSNVTGDASVTFTLIGETKAVNIATGFGTGQYFTYHWTADAEL